MIFVLEAELVVSRSAVAEIVHMLETLESQRGKDWLGSRGAPCCSASTKGGNAVAAVPLLIQVHQPWRGGAQHDVNLF